MSQTLRDELLTLPKTAILDLFCTLRGAATCGFNHELVKKSECIDRLLAEYGETRVLEAYDRSSPAAPAASPAAPAAPAVNAAAQQIGSLLAQLAGQATVDEAAVRRIVAETAVDSEAVRAIVAEALAAQPPRRVEIKIGDRVVAPEGHVRPEFEKVLRRSAVGLNTLMVGPAGSGKTHLAHQVAEALGRPFASVSCTAGMSESVLSGWLIPGEAGAFRFLESDFVRLYEGGGVFLFDEADAADANTLLFINQALANGSFHLPQREGRSLVKRHPDFVCLAAANTWGLGSTGGYAGRERLDESFLDRFRAGRVAIGYDEAFERQTVDPGLLSWGHRVRARIAELRLQRVLSTRFLLDGTKLLAVGETLDDVKNAFFLDWKAEDRTKVEA